MKNPRILCHGVLRTEASPQLELLHSGSLTTLVYGFRLAFCYSFGFQVLRLCATPEGNLAQFTLVITSAGAHTLAFPPWLHQVPVYTNLLFVFSKDLLPFLACCRPLTFLTFPFIFAAFKILFCQPNKVSGGGGGAETNLRGEHTLCNSNNHK